MAEEARLESVCTPKGYREFESRSLRAMHALTIAAQEVRQFLLRRQLKRKLAFVLTVAAINRGGFRPASQCIARGDPEMSERSDEISPTSRA